MKPNRSSSRSRSTEALAFALLTSLSCGAAGQTLQNTGALSFGSFATSAGGTVTVTPGGARGNNSSAVVLVSGGGMASAAQFLFTGTSGQLYAITMPADGTTFLSDGVHTMALNAFASSAAGNQLVATGTAQSISIGATLTVSVAQAPGSYSGSFNVTVDYP